MNKAAMAVVAIVAITAGVWFGSQQNKVDLSNLSGFSFPQPALLKDIDLINYDSERLTEEYFKDQWTFVYVGYTKCPDACPETLLTLNRINTLINEDQVNEDQAQVNTLLVSVDPERDTPSHLKDYVKFFNEGFHAATGTPDKIKHFADQVSALYALPEDRSDPNYLVDHSSSIVLINPDGAVQAIFTPPQEAAALVKDFEVLSAHYGSS